MSERNVIEREGKIPNNDSGSEVRLSGDMSKNCLLF